MSIIHVRKVPEDLYNDLKDLAKEKNRSLSAQVITILSNAIKIEKQRKEQSRLLLEIHNRRFTPPDHAPNSTELLCEDRQR
jgi:plasmid stability protein